MNEVGVFPAIFGIGVILAAIIVLLMLFLVWTFWKPLFVFAIGCAILYAAFFVVPTLTTKKQAFKAFALTAAVGAAIVLISLSPLSGFLSLTGQQGYVAFNYPSDYHAKGFIYFIDNATVSPTMDFKLRAGIELPDSYYYTSTYCTRAYQLIVSVDGQALMTSSGNPYCGLSAYGCNSPTGPKPFVGGECIIPYSSFAGKSGKIQVKLSHSSDTRAYYNYVEAWVDNSACILSETTFVAAETFGPGKTVSRNSLRLSPIAYCSQLPILVTQAGSIVDRKLEEYQIMNDSYVTIPAGQTWTFFYVANLPAAADTCSVGFTFDEATGKCQPIPGVWWFCSSGILDPVEGYCQAGPEPCEMGYFDLGRNKCVYQIPGGSTSAICPARNLLVETSAEGLERCVYDPDPDRFCGKGYYDKVEKVCKWVPQPIPLQNIFEVLGSVFASFWAWVLGLFGW